MSGRRNRWIASGVVLSVGLIVAAVVAWSVACRDGRRAYALLNAVCAGVIERDPEAWRPVAAALKDVAAGNEDAPPEADVLSSLGYRASDFSGLARGQTARFAAAGGLAGLSLFLLTFLCRNRREERRIRALAGYLAQINSGKAAVLSPSGEDEFSKLEDEIYKTVTALEHTRDQAVRSKADFAENLSNIAHQLKTPMTAISLSVQRLRQGFDRTALAQVEKQLARLTSLEESLLLLSRLDAGVLPLRQEEIDVLTLLVLAADHLQELSSGVSVEIPELGEMRITADMDWTMEAVMNLMKNCIEHGRGGVVRCSCAQNPFYTEILIEDDGEGFAKEDLPHLFERFYRGRNAREGGIGIGLALAKAIIERQNGTIRARNKPDGGALFEIRFYRH